MRRFRSGGEIAPPQLAGAAVHDQRPIGPGYHMQSLMRRRRKPLPENAATKPELKHHPHLAPPSALDERSSLAGLRAISAVEAIKGLAVILLMLVVFSVHSRVDEIAESLLFHLHMNPDRRIGQAFLNAASRLGDMRLLTIAAMAMSYALVRFIESWGLWHRRVWAEWFALLSGMLYLPWEIAALVEHRTAAPCHNLDRERGYRRLHAARSDCIVPPFRIASGAYHHRMSRSIPSSSKLIQPYCVANGAKFRLKHWDPADTQSIAPSLEERRAFHQAAMQRIDTLQQMLSAEAQWSVLLIIQAMDAAGKDSLIRHAMSGINPQSCQVYSFKQPSVEELSHDYLWRATKALPERGQIGIFNRSYYEEVLVARVHPEILEAQRLPASLTGKTDLERAV